MCKSLYFAMVEVDVYMDEYVGGFEIFTLKGLSMCKVAF
jgi:hypothetical protein